MDPKAGAEHPQTVPCPNCGHNIEVTQATTNATCSACSAELVVSHDRSGRPLADLAGMTAGVSSAALDDQTRRRIEGELQVLRTSRLGLSRLLPLLAPARHVLLLARVTLMAALAVGVVIVMAADKLWLGFLAAGLIVAVGTVAALVSVRRKRREPAASVDPFDQALAAREAQLRGTLTALDQTPSDAPNNDA